MDRTSAFRPHLLKLRRDLLENLASREFAKMLYVLQVGVDRMEYWQIKTMSYSGAVRDPLPHGGGFRYTDPGNVVYSVTWFMMGLYASHVRRHEPCNPTQLEALRTCQCNRFRAIQKRVLERWPRAPDSVRMAETIGDMFEFVLGCSYVSDRLDNVAKMISAIVLQVRNIIDYIEWSGSWERIGVKQPFFRGHRAHYIWRLSCAIYNAANVQHRDLDARHPDFQPYQDCARRFNLVYSGDRP